MKILLSAIILLLIGAFFIISQNNLALSKEGSIKELVSLYIPWLIAGGENIVQLSGQIIKLEWLPE